MEPKFPAPEFETLSLSYSSTDCREVTGAHLMISPIVNKLVSSSYKFSQQTFKKLTRKRSPAKDMIIQLVKEIGSFFWWVEGEFPFIYVYLFT